MPEPTDAARAIRLEAMRRRDGDVEHTHNCTCTATMDRRWLLGEIERLSGERDQAQAQSHADLDAAIKYNAERENAGHITSKAWDMVTALELERDQLRGELASATEQLAALLSDYERDVTS